MIILQVEEIPGLGQYDDFHTIDWQRDIARDRTRHRLSLLTLFNKSSWFNSKVYCEEEARKLIRSYTGCTRRLVRCGHQSFLGQNRNKWYLLMERLRWLFPLSLQFSSGWVCVLLVGLMSGVMAGVIDIGATWLTDLKFGICPTAFYLNMEQCCWSSNETVRKEE